MFARYRAMNYIRDHKREVPLAEITMSEDRYPNSLIDDRSGGCTAERKMLS